MPINAMEKNVVAQFDSDTSEVIFKMEDHSPNSLTYHYLMAWNYKEQRAMTSEEINAFMEREIYGG